MDQAQVNEVAAAPPSRRRALWLSLAWLAALAVAADTWLRFLLPEFGWIATRSGAVNVAVVAVVWSLPYVLVLATDRRRRAALSAAQWRRRQWTQFGIVFAWCVTSVLVFAPVAFVGMLGGEEGIVGEAVFDGVRYRSAWCPGHVDSTATLYRDKPLLPGLDLVSVALQWRGGPLELRVVADGVWCRQDGHFGPDEWTRVPR